ncbi:MAG: hypothetical protein MZU91_01210 [Desulfosudis oleivorans]|nr:hypothetical protein [Desulfosudis oleivorans]
MLGELRRECKTHDNRGAAALSKHLARPCAKCLRSRGACFAPTALRLGNATMALRWVPTQLSGALRQRSAIPGSSIDNGGRSGRPGRDWYIDRGQRAAPTCSRSPVASMGFVGRNERSELRRMKLDPRIPLRSIRAT